MSSTARSSEAAVNYFTCTLGEAVGKTPKVDGVNTINDFLDHQSRTNPEDYAVGFPVPKDGPDGDWGYELFTFGDLRSGSIAVAEQTARLVQEGKLPNSETVALLCPSSIDFIFAWLGLMRAGRSVLLIAPQCQPAAIVHLCNVCDVSVIFYDVSFENLASKAVAASELKIRAAAFPWQSQHLTMRGLIKNLVASEHFQPAIGNAYDTAFIFHTSGTSSGLPKPIPQTHHAAFGVLPRLDGHDHATFTTTPLYHGGIADCFRAWTSRALIWLFPAANIPITAKNIQSSMKIADKASLERSVANVKYFSSVPYVLQMLNEDPASIELLRRMDIVGVGGAALNQHLGDSLIRQEINLVSRFGSAECGFLLSSHRDYAVDEDWQYFRLASGVQHLSFEEFADESGLAELIVGRRWPHLVKFNRADGSLATSDLFQPHPRIKGAWRYHSRSDSQITLNTGKKFDPTSLEDLLACSSPFIREVLVFGSGKESAGALIFLSVESQNKNDADIEREVWDIVKAANEKGEVHTRISRDQLVMMSVNEPPLERSSKGTLLRGVAEKRYANDIDKAYSSGGDSSFGERKFLANGVDMKSLVRKTVNSMLITSEYLEDDADFYSHGIDSAMSTRIRAHLQKCVEGNVILPWNVVYDCGNINRLSKLLEESRNGIVASQPADAEEIQGFVSKYSNFHPRNEARDESKRAKGGQKVVLLTGATGALGANILSILRKDASISRIVCLVRAENNHEAAARISASLVKHKKDTLNGATPEVSCFAFKLSAPDLGLCASDMTSVKQETTHLIHAAWAVNFSLPLKSFADEHIAGVRNLVNLILSCAQPVQFTFCSSTASVLNVHSPLIILEDNSSEPSDAGPLGYSKSKWVAEALCAMAAKRALGLVKILRVGQLTGDTEHGVWNRSEAWPLMLSTVDVLGCLPDLDESLTWLPLDVAARAVIEIAFHESENEGNCRVYHVVNNKTETKWSDLLAWTQDIRSRPFDVVQTSLWLEKLENFPGDHPSKSLLGFWKTAYSDGQGGGQAKDNSMQSTFATTQSCRESEAMRNVQAVDRTLIEKIWSWLDDEMGIKL